MFLVSIIVALQEVGQVSCRLCVRVFVCSCVCVFVWCIYREVVQISGFLVGSNCNSINPFIKNTLIPLGFLPPGIYWFHSMNVDFV